MSPNHDASLAPAPRQARPRTHRPATFREQSARVADEVRELGRLALAKAGDAAATLRAKGGNVFDAGFKRATKAKGQIDEVVGKNPMKSVLIAMGIGVVFGYALGRRR